MVTMSLEIERKFLLPAYPQALIENGQIMLKSEERIDGIIASIMGLACAIEEEYGGSLVAGQWEVTVV